jgi:hypothetical protein
VVDPLLVTAGAALIVSCVLTFIIGRRSASAYSLTGRSHLLNFSAGFFCLGLSYIATIVLVVALYYPFPPNVIPTALDGSALVPRLFIELLGYALIASSYYSRERAGSLVLLVLLTVALVGAMVSSTYYSVFSNMSISGTIHVLELALIMYTLIQISRSYTTRIVRGSVYVSWGFGMLTLSQYTWMIWSFGDSSITAAFAVALRLLGLALLVYSLRQS